MWGERQKRKLHQKLFLFFCILVTCAISNADSVSQEALAGSAIVVIDDGGHKVTLDRPAQRIITLAPHLTEQIYTAGGGNRIVATVNYSNYPQAAQDILRIGGYKKISFEVVVSLNPDLILAFGGNGIEMINRLRGLGFTVYVDEPRELEDVASTIENFGILLGTEKIASQAAQDFTERYKKISDRYREQRTVSVFYEVWNQPLITINGEHLISSVMRLCGGRNVFSEALPLAPRISTESVIRSNPEVIIASGHGEQRPDWLDDWVRWPSISAVQHGHLYFIPPDILQRHTVRILDGAEKMCYFLEKVRIATTTPSMTKSNLVQ